MMLYWGSGSPPCWRVQIALEEKNLQGYQHKLLSFDKGEHKCEEVMKLNPRGQVILLNLQLVTWWHTFNPHLHSLMNLFIYSFACLASHL